MSVVENFAPYTATVDAIPAPETPFDDVEGELEADVEAHEASSSVADGEVEATASDEEIVENAEETEDAIPAPTFSVKIDASFYEVEKTAKKMKGTKKRFTWALDINGFDYTVEFTHSKISGKRRLFVNRELVHYERHILFGGNKFAHAWTEHGHQFSFAYSKARKAMWLSIDGEEFLPPTVTDVEETQEENKTAGMNTPSRYISHEVEGGKVVNNADALSSPSTNVGTAAQGASSNNSPARDNNAHGEDFLPWMESPQSRKHLTSQNQGMALVNFA